MKKISLFLGSFLLLASCTSTQWAIIGDVTAYNSDGSVLRQWDDVVIESGYSDNWSGKQTTSYAMKTFGINFSDPVTQKNIIISNAVPCIIEYDNSIDIPEEGYKIQSTTLDSFKNDEIYNLSKEQQRELAKSFITEINYDIKNAVSEQDMLLIKEKIEVLIKFNNSLPKKNYLIIDALSSIRYEYKQKAKKLGINL